MKFVLQVLGLVFLLIALNYVFDKFVYQGSEVQVYKLITENADESLKGLVHP